MRNFESPYDVISIHDGWSNIVDLLDYLGESVHAFRDNAGKFWFEVSSVNDALKDNTVDVKSLQNQVYNLQIYHFLIRNDKVKNYNDLISRGITLEKDLFLHALFISEKLLYRFIAIVNTPKAKNIKTWVVNYAEMLHDAKTNYEIAFGDMSLVDDTTARWPILQKCLELQRRIEINKRKLINPSDVEISEQFKLEIEHAKRKQLLVMCDIQESSQQKLNNLIIKIHVERFT